MEDKDILALYWRRDQAAIGETAAKYGSYCAFVARNILENAEDTEECVNDAWLHAWDSIPPHRPQALRTYLGKLTRNLAFDRWRRRRADKRGGGQTEEILEELAGCLTGGGVEEELDRRELGRAVNSFLDTLPEKKRGLFLCRYWYACPVTDIAKRFGMTENAVSVALSRIREQLKKYLMDRGYEV